MNLKDFQCKCGHCSWAEPHPELKRRVEFLERWYERPAIISSGYRCEARNKEIGGSRNSKHIERIAVDINFANISRQRLYHLLDRGWPDSYGVGIYNSHVHFDIRAGRARWDFRHEKTEAIF